MTLYTHGAMTVKPVIDKHAADHVDDSFTKARRIDPAKRADLRGLHEECIRFFNFANARLYGGALPLCTFGFYPQPPNGRRLGHYIPNAWEGTPFADEIALTVDLCLQSGVDWIFATVLHEMVHHWQHHLGKQEPHGNHHNIEWWTELIRVGLEAEGDSRRSRGFTKPGAGYLALLKDFSPAVDKIPFRSEARARGKGKMRKYTCSCEPAVCIRVGKSVVSILCLDCKALFVEAQ